MRKAEIMTDQLDYLVDIPQESAGDVMTAWKYVKDAITANMPLEGTIVGQPATFSIEAGSSIKHIKIFDDAAADLVAAPDPTAIKPKAPTVGYYDFTIARIFAGQRVDITGLAYFDDGVDYYLPRYVNDEPAAEAISTENLVNLIRGWCNENKENEYVILPPPQGLDLSDVDEARAFISDYIDAASKADSLPAEKKTAKAWGGWKGGVNT